jgi:Methyltransferase domain
VVARSDGTEHHLFPVAVGVAEGEALGAWVVREGATRTIEVGLGYDISALFVCEALLGSGDPAARHVVVDPHQATRFANCGLQVLEDAGVAALVEHHAEESQIALPRFLGAGRRFELAFVDGNHPFDGVFLDLVSTSGRSCAPPRSPTRGRSTPTSSSDPSPAAPGGPRTGRGCRHRRERPPG